MIFKDSKLEETCVHPESGDKVLTFGKSLCDAIYEGYLTLGLKVEDRTENTHAGFAVVSNLHAKSVCSDD